MTFIDAVGFIPAIIFPIATLIQLVYIVRRKNSEGVSVIAWSAFALGNISLYIYTEKYFALQSIMGQLLTTVLQILIVVLAIKYRKINKASE